MARRKRLLAILTVGAFATLGSLQVNAGPLPIERQGPAYRDTAQNTARDTARPKWCKKKKNKDKKACQPKGERGGQDCHPSYTGPGVCLDPNASDYDCAGGSGDGPKYTGQVNVVGPDEYGLDSDGDGTGCE